jgi:hypothetical protein
MNLLSSVSSAAVALAAGLEPTTTITTSPDRSTGAAGGLASARTPDLLTAMLDATTGSSKSSKGTGKTTAKTPAKTTIKTASTKTTSKTATKTTAGSSGYGKPATTDAFAFLKDPKLSVEEKLFQFMCAIAKRNDDEVLKKLEEMKGGAATASKASTTGGSGGTGSARRPAAVSTWSALKSLIPPLGLAAQLVGDAKLKSMITQVSGPVLAAAVTALGMPALAPLALKAGPQLATAIVNGKLGGSGAAAAAGEGSQGGSSSGSTSGSSTSTSSAAGRNEQVQLMELQRLIDKQKEMFAMVSNILRAQHDTRMVMIGNVR